MTGLPDLRDFVRPEPLPPSATLIVRGGPDSVAKLEAHAERLRRAYVLDGAPVLGISVFAATDDIGPASVDGIAAGKLSTYRVLHTVPVGQVTAAGVPIAAHVPATSYDAAAGEPGPRRRSHGAARSRRAEPTVW